MFTTITAKSKAIQSTIPISVSTLICIAVFFLAGHDTVNAGVNAHHRGFDVGSQHDKPEGVWSDGETMWILDDRGDRSELIAYRLATGARLPDKDIDLSSNNDKPQGITSDGTIMWVADWDDRKIYAYDIDSQSRVPNRDIDLTGSNDAPRGIATDTHYMFVVDKEDKRVYVYLLSNGQYLSTITFALHGNNDHPWGIWSTPRSPSSELWVTDHSDDIVYRYDYVRDTSDPAFRLPVGSGDPKGIWSDEKHFWIVDDDDDHVYAVTYEGFRQQGADISISGTTEPTGAWTDGTTIWVGNKGVTHDTLLAYDLSDGSPTNPNFFLTDNNEDPVAMWSDDAHIWVCDADDGLLYAYETDQIGAYSPSNLKALASGNANPTGIWSDGDVMWVADKSDDKLYAYEWPQMTRHETRDISLASGNGNPGNIWSDGVHIWVFDRTRKNAYAYSLDDGVRQRSQEFRPAPQNDRFSGGMTGHRQRVWILDTRDEKLYAYLKLNTEPSFTADSVRFEIHHSLPVTGLVGALPEATDADGDSLTYRLRGADSSRFYIDHNLRIRSGVGATFTGGESLSFEATVHDGKSQINRTNQNADDYAKIYVDVLHNADPEFVIPNVESFMVAENASETDVIADLDVTDPDGDTLIYGIDASPTHPFQVTDGQIKLKAGETLDYEGTTSYDLTVRVRDNKDDNGGEDTGWDDDISITIEVTNVDEAGTVTLGSNNPEVNVSLSASLTDPDGSISDLAWQWQRADTADATTWTDISGATASSYTPASGDAGKFIRARASYDDGEGTDKTAVGTASNAVLAETPSNQSPSFTEGATATRSVREDATPGDFVGAPVVATDPNMDDTLAYRLIGEHDHRFGINFNSGQIFLKVQAFLNYERQASYTVNVRVRDSKDADGEDDILWDAFIDVTINVTDVDEPGEIEFDSDHPQVGTKFAAHLDDEDLPISNLSWQWQTADTADATGWVDIDGATTVDYTPVFADHGKFLRAQATYDDKHGTGKTVHGTSTNAVPQRPANRPPEFDEGSTTTRSVSEAGVTGTRLGAAVVASDADGDALTYSLATGNDSAKFTVDSATGELEVAAGALLDFETGSSLSVVVQVTDGLDSGHNSDTTIDDTITVTVSLINADELGKVSLSTSRPQFDEAITATLKDPDGGKTSITWQWAKSHDSGNTWTDLAGETADTYTPVAEDEGALLRATASYADAEGSGKSANVVSLEKVTGSGNGEAQQNKSTPEPNFYDRCLRDMLAGSVANCGRDSFASFRVELDGRYIINWSEWNAAHPDVTGYTIFINEFVYMKYYVGNTEVIYDDLADVYESCQFADNRWHCQGPLKSNYYQDMSGNPTRMRVVALDVEHTELSANLEAPGRWMSDQSFHRWSGDETDPNNEPTAVTYRRLKLEMDLYHFRAHGGSAGGGTVLIDGANGFDELPE